MSTVNAAETVDVLVRTYGWSADDVAAGVAQLLSTVDPVPASLDAATQAGELRARHFRRDQRISLADCFVLATAGPSDRIVTGDVTLASVASDEGIDVVMIGA
jgi:PIN domain nuclease of toxin-antitoxin system